MFKNRGFRTSVPSEDDQNINIDQRLTVMHKITWPIVLWFLATAAIIGLVLYMNWGTGTGVDCAVN